MGWRPADRLRGRARSSPVVEWEQQWCGAFGGDDLDQLLTNAGHGDLAAFAEFYDLTAPFVFATLCRLCDRHDGVEAEQLTEHIYVQVWRQAPLFDAREHGAAAVLLAHVRGETTRAVLARSAA